MERELTFRILLETPPAGVDFGLQKGRGSIYEVIQKQRSGPSDPSFIFTAGVKGVSKDPGVPDFTGSFIQGPRGQRFIYIDIGSAAGQTDSPWSRRLKIPLSGITWDMIEQAADNPRMVLETRVAGAGRDGGPTCGTVKPFDGWNVRKLAQ
jgi:Family of unknown function (DUF5990)